MLCADDKITGGNSEINYIIMRSDKWDDTCYHKSSKIQKTRFICLYNLAGRESNYLALGLCNIVLYSTNASYYKLSPDCEIRCWGLKTNWKYSFMSIIPFTHKFDLITFKTASPGNHTFSSWVTFVTSMYSVTIQQIYGDI